MDDAAARRAAQAWFAHTPRLSPLGAGHINATWLAEGDGGAFVLQRLSDAVFPHPVTVMRKVARVVEHLASDSRVGTPALIPTRQGEGWLEDEQGVVWRLWEHVAGTRTLERLTSVAQGEAAGAAFGQVQLALADLPGPVEDPIPGFLRLPVYLRELDDAAAVAPAGDAVEAALAVVDARRNLAVGFSGCDRLIHGDCKVNNLLFHQHRDEVARVIDLDTVMRGHWGWDFGDLVRSAAADDDRFDVARFAAIAGGFVRSGALERDGPVADLVEALVAAPRHVALMLGVRFLTDHLRGDRYFRVQRRGDNLRRARAQLTLLEDMERQAGSMEDAVRCL